MSARRPEPRAGPQMSSMASGHPGWIACGGVDGYPREAISNIAASLERFLEYYIWVVALKHSIPAEAVLDARKPMSQSSERQLGAFLLAYLIENGRAVDPLVFDSRPALEGRAKRDTPTWSAFRNRVIHQGYIPSTVEAFTYGDLVYQWIYRLIGELKSSCAEAMSRVTFQNLRRASDVSPAGTVATMSIPTLISLVRADGPARSFKDALAGLEKYRRWLYEPRSS